MDVHCEYDTSAFHGKTIDNVVCLLRERVTGNKVATNVFYIADDQTIRDHSLLLVQVQPQEKDGSLLSVRLACEFVNLMARSISYPENPGLIQDVQNDVDDDGVYRGGRKNPYIYCGTRTPYLDKQDALETGKPILVLIPRFIAEIMVLYLSIGLLCYIKTADRRMLCTF
jgi:hypothetical protein